jgi:16S rRNA (adenine(1408)-N(1))-methyltransferase
MEIIRGKHASKIQASALAEMLGVAACVHIDLGTGDGRYVRHMAQTCPEMRVIGVDACRENLAEASRRAPENALYVIANALMLPIELNGLADSISINFPWGSLLKGLLQPEPALLSGLCAISRAGAALDIRLNAGALAEAGWAFEAGVQRIRAVLADHDIRMSKPLTLTPESLKAIPTTWAKRLTFGRDPRAVTMRGEMPNLCG